MPSAVPTRRDFLRKIPAAAALIAAHEVLGFEGQSALPTATTQAGSEGRSAEPLIKGLRLLTASPLGLMREFYGEKLGLSVVHEKEGELGFAGGATRLTFVTVSPDQLHGDGGRGRGEPFYHFAFNIPPDKLQAGRAWQLERTPLIEPRPGLRDPLYPDDVWHFRHWNAHSIFFWDPAYNIVEFIARHDLKAGASDGSREGLFTTADILYASEIGYVFDPTQQVRGAEFVHRKLGLRPYPRGTDSVWAMGDEHGLLLCLARKGEPWGEHTGTPVKWDVFPTEATIRGSPPGTHEFDGFPYRVHVE